MARTLKATVSKNKLKDKIKATSNLQNKLRNLAHEPQHALPDVFIWLISNHKRIAYHRIPAKDIVFSIVDEERGKECGRVQTLFLKLPGKKGTGPTGWAVQAKLQMYLWLGLSKHKKELLKGLPAGYEDTPQIRRACRIVGSPPPSIKYTGSDASGLSDPFARVVFGDQSQCTQVIDETLSPTWDEMLIFNEVTIYGTIEEIKDYPPTIVVEIFDQDRVGKAEFIGRALAKPTVKKSDEKYERPNFPPQLEWSDICRGPDRAGELLAAFELLQVLFWGMRELKKIHFTSVDKPRIDVECAGHVLSSSVIVNSKKNPNFTIPVKFFDVELPDNELYCPPITIRCVDCRNFGRFVLVGTHVINNIHKFMYVPTTKTAKEAWKKFLGGGGGGGGAGGGGA
ncbi:hypothetical protein LSH36_251g03028 [Paralvinella palmiformis]|uniref:C2 domain-containing protein n=1 Tax=Paralvinella palmiformis TaxID=53620 RepID=A0AAD9JM48_9ANNE|nr:hypothetical protein LSH36_251g03028 [Paralvinella palmiformis]